MSKILHKFAVVVAATSISVGLLSAVAVPADAAVHAGPVHVTPSRADTGWPT